jgi:hypothetical protein
MMSDYPIDFVTPFVQRRSNGSVMFSRKRPRVEETAHE